MPKEVSVKLILALRANGISMRKIEAILHVLRYTISTVYKSADSHSVLWENVKDLDEDKVYQMLFPSLTVNCLIVILI